ncbi:MAG: MFS transporter [Candidatus Promineifilaceae bacterium]|nr:MFS transporter [Candidatus Promineifilaceae bacterium]
MTAAAGTKKISPFAVFRNRSFTRLWLAQLISTIGDAFTMIAAGIYIFRLTGSTLQVGLMLIATSVPTMLLGLVAGVFVDRFDRKKIMVYADLARALLVFAIPFLLPYNNIWLYIIVMLISSIGTFFHPAFDSVVPETASDEELTAANSMIAISSFGSTAVGFAAAGFISEVSIEWAFYADALTFLLSAVFLMGLKVKPIELEEETNVHTVVRNLREGLHFLYNDTLLRSILIVGSIYALAAGMWNTMLLPFATEALGASEFEYGLQEAATSIGFVIGSFFIARYADRLRAGIWISLSLVGMGLFGIVYALSSSLPLAVAMITITGFLNAWYYVARRTLIQRNTEREIRGRIFGAIMTLGHVIMLIGMGTAGAADYIGVRQMMLVAVIISGLAGVVALFIPGIGRPPAEWLRAVNLLRQAPEAPLAEAGRPATFADFRRLRGHLPALAFLDNEARDRMIDDGWVMEATEGEVIIREGEISDAAYFIIAGRAIAGRSEGERERVLEVLNAGDFFGEIAALTGIPRTANIIVDQPSTLLRIAAPTLREMSGTPELNRVFMSKMTERMVRMDMIELPKQLTLDQTLLKELRTEIHDPAPGTTVIAP